MVIVDTHVHVFTDDRKKYPQLIDTPRAGSIPSITEIGQTPWPVTTVETLATLMDEAGIDKATLVQAYFVYEYDNSYTCDAARLDPKRFASVVVLDPLGNDTKGQSLSMRARLLGRVAVGHRSRQGGNLRDPATVVFALELDGEVHGISVAGVYG